MFCGSGLKGGSGVSSKAKRLPICSYRGKDEDFLPMADKGCHADEQRAEMLKLASSGEKKVLPL